MKKDVLFLCTGNSCRSQMAEALANHDHSRDWVAYSAGTEPAGYVHPLATRVMAELDIDISDQSSKSVDAFRSIEPDLVVTVCDDAAANCPVWLGRGHKIHVGFEDPAKATGSEVDRLAVFRRVRDEIRDQLSIVLPSRL